MQERTFRGIVPLERASTVDRVTEMLRDELLSGRLAPGTTLQEIPLATALRVSRNTLREAVRTLVAEGLLTRTPHKGIVISNLTPADVDELFEVRELLESAALEKACAMRSGILPILNEKIEGLRRAMAAGNERSIVEMDLAFHQALLSALGSTRLQHFHAVLISELRLALAVLDRDGGGASIKQMVAQHQQIVAAIKTGNVARSQQLLLRHLRDSKDRLKSLLRQRENKDK
ncbi:MAG: GntR family transcriptional regulator [Acidobacteria bacterium]|nr:GntR family transcriptional regulator [Acidobacteriota bacterium]